MHVFVRSRVRMQHMLTCMFAATQIPTASMRATSLILASLQSYFIRHCVTVYVQMGFRPVQCSVLSMPSYLDFPARLQVTLVAFATWHSIRDLALFTPSV